MFDDALRLEKALLKLIIFYIAITGCMAALDAEHYLQEIGGQEGKSD
jgi:hypothetical protein